jgi:Tetratricopeptide repeat
MMNMFTNKKIGKLLLVISLTCCSLFTVPAASEEKGAREFFKEGVGFYKDGKFDEAAESFKKAYDLKPTFKLLFNIGQAYAANKKYDLAVKAFEQYLVDGGDDLTDERRGEVLAEIAKLRPLVGFIGIEAPEGIDVFIDDTKRGVTPLSNKIMLTVGHPHAIELRRGDEVLLSRSLSVHGGLVEMVKYEDKKEEPVVAETPETSEQPGFPAEEEEEPTNKLKLWGWVSTGVGAAVLAGGAVLGGMALGQDGSLDKACPDTTCSPNRSGEVDALNGMGLGADIMFAVGGAIAATGIVLLIVDATKKESPDDGNGGFELTVVPTPMGVSAGIRF